MEILNQKKIILGRQDIVALVNKELESFGEETINPQCANFFISEGGGDPFKCNFDHITISVNKNTMREFKL